MINDGLDKTNSNFLHSSNYKVTENNKDDKEASSGTVGRQPNDCLRTFKVSKNSKISSLPAGDDHADQEDSKV